MSCFGGSNEQIYLIEILIDKLTLTPVKIKDIGEHPIVIKIVFLDLPVFEFTRDSDAPKRDHQEDVRFLIGKSCLFVKRPRDLVSELRSTKVRIGVFRKGDTYPTAETDLILPGCLCDQVAMIGNDPDNQPAPFTVKGGFHLVDPGENPSGTLYLELVIACLGRVFKTNYEIRPKSLASDERDKEREIYVIRFVSPEFLDKIPEKAEITPKVRDLMIRVNFIDFTSVDIVAEEGKKIKNKEKRFSDECVKYEGKTCLFVRPPSNLIQSIKSTPLSVEVYRILRGEEECNSRDDTGQVLVCIATEFLPGYFCDRVIAAKTEIDGLSKPYTMMQVYTLADQQGYPCGSISMYLRLSCFGSSIINHLTLREKSFVFRGFPLGWKFHCAGLSDQSINDEKNRLQREDNTFSLLSKILDPAYSELHDEKYIDTDARFALTRPESPPRVSMNEPGFEKLTSAEKLNDRKYRGLIYEIYPDEPTCSCLPTNQSTHPMMCRSGCVRSCCMALRNPDILKNISSLATLNDRVDNLPSGAERDANSDNTRMRGGEDTGDNLNNKMLWSKECTEWYSNNINFKNRMKGGSDYGASAYAASETSVTYEKSKEACNSPGRRPRTADGAVVAGRYVCPGQEMSSWRPRSSQCTKKPCVGADCMIRAFKEAQDFVDSIGKVPGLVGLGLMDPSESPYFGREIDKDYSVQEIPSEKKRAYPPVSAFPYLQCTAPCNTQLGTVASSIPIPGRAGVVREAIPSIPDATLVPITVKPKKKEDKKEEKLEKQKEKELDVTTVTPDVDVGPCGEPKCKSRRKKVRDNRIPPREETIEELQKSVTLSSSITTKGVSKYIAKQQYPRSKALPGPAGDRDVARGESPIKISKRVMRFIYSIGDVYPGTNYGHRNCIDPRLRVPANMGWLWNTSTTVGKLKPRIGWKPGAISRYLSEMLKEAKKGAPPMEDSRPRLVPSRTGLRRGKLYKSLSYVSQLKKEAEDEVEPPPTLHIHRKDGTYYVTMYPIRQETAEPQLEEPMKPLQFKIARNKDDASVATSSTASDMEIEFSPPAAVNRYRRKPDVIHVDTQVRQQEILDAFKSTVDVPKKRDKKGKKGRK
ncbi:uncharacterized protein LOC114942990 [Nylanderia fulva]|uniref:uncharacterized protein LOC114942990 n=1 Tax=Nylanderia fulva TaxID=613905 RepID=UPI0010FB50D6|nr:uncharacterized protein LOC114942990 [Nylanderia fulva]